MYTIQTMMSIFFFIWGCWQSHIWKDLDCKQLNHGSKGGKHFIQTSVGNFPKCRCQFLCISSVEKKKILCSLVQNYSFTLISFFSSWQLIYKFDMREERWSRDVRSVSSKGRSRHRRKTPCFHWCCWLGTSFLLLFSILSNVLYSQQRA